MRLAAGNREIDVRDAHGTGIDTQLGGAAQPGLDRAVQGQGRQRRAPRWRSLQAGRALAAERESPVLGRGVDVEAMRADGSVRLDIQGVDGATGNGAAAQADGGRDRGLRRRCGSDRRARIDAQRRDAKLGIGLVAGGLTTRGLITGGLTTKGLTTGGLTTGLAQPDVVGRDAGPRPQPVEGAGKLGGDGGPAGETIVQPRERRQFSVDGQFV